MIAVDPIIEMDADTGKISPIAQQHGISRLTTHPSSVITTTELHLLYVKGKILFQNSSYMIKKLNETSFPQVEAAVSCQS